MQVTASLTVYILPSLGKRAEQQRAENEVRNQRAAQRAEEERRVREKRENRENRAYNWSVAIIGAIVAGTIVLLIGKFFIH
jgi:hypothetical protein